MNIRKAVTGLLAAMALAWAPAAYAADNGTEFGIEDDLTVLGVEGTAADPDAEIKGFTVFGATQAAYTGAVVGAGNVVVNGYLAVSSGAYFVGGSTFASAGAYFTGISSFSDVSKIHIAGGAANQVLKKVAGGGMAWADDSLGAGEISGTPQRLVMYQADGTGGADSLLQQDPGNTSITMVTGSSMTILGAFKANGAATLAGTLDLTGDATLSNNLTVAGITSLNGLINLGNAAADLVTIQGPVTVMGASSITVKGALEVDGAAKLDGNVALGDAAADLLTVNAQSSFVAGSTFTAGAYFQSISSFSNVANIHIAGGAANQVLKKVAGGGMVWANDNDGGAASITGTPRRVTMIDASGTGLVSSQFLQNGTDLGVTLMANSSMTVTGAFEAAGATKLNGNVNLGDATGDNITAAGLVTAQFGVSVTGGDVAVTNNLNVDGNARLGNAVSDTHGINKAAEAGVALSVDSAGASGNYAAKFYSNGSLAAWIKKK